MHGTSFAYVLTEFSQHVDWCLEWRNVVFHFFLHIFRYPSWPLL